MHFKVFPCKRIFSATSKPQVDNMKNIYLSRPQRKGSNFYKTDFVEIYIN